MGRRGREIRDRGCAGSGPRSPSPCRRSSCRHARSELLPLSAVSLRLPWPYMRAATFSGSVAGDEPREPASTIFDNATLRLEIYIDESKALTVPFRPLEVIE